MASHGRRGWLSSRHNIDIVAQEGGRPQDISREAMQRSAWDGSDAHDFLAGGGEMGARIRLHDWAATPLGPIETWPQSLRMALSICLGSNFPTAIYWGPELRLLYNDAWVPIPAERHPWALGRPAVEVWADIWDVVGPQFLRAIELGEGLSAYDQMLPMVRDGVACKTYWNYSLTPIRGEGGRIVGVINQGHETTDRVLGERRQAFLLALEDRLVGQSDPRAVMDASVEALGRHLGADRVGYSEVRADGETIDCDACFATRIAPIVGTFKLADFGAKSIARQRNGLTEVCDDVLADPAQAHATWAAIETRAYVSVPLVRNGRLRASLYVNFREPHRWTPAEVTLIEDVAGRTWDAVERAKAEKALRALNETLEVQVSKNAAERDRVWRNSRDLLLVIDRWWNIRAVNPAVTTLLGYAIEEAAGRRFSEFMHPDDLKAAAHSIRAAASTPVGDFEARLRAKDGSWRWFSWSAAPGEGEAYVIGRDVTAENQRQAELAQAEAARRQADALYRAYFENTAEALFVVGVREDDSFTVEEINPAFEALTGLRNADIRGKPLDEQLPAGLARAAAENYRRAAREARPIVYREVLGLPAGLRHWDTVLVPVRREDGRVWRIIGSARDVTAQVVAEEALRQSQKLEAMGQLTGGVAHDFNNLLSPIIGGLDMLQRRGVGDERDQRMIAGALASAERAKTLVQRLLAFARRQPLQTTAVDVQALVEGMADLVASTTGPQVKVVVEVAPGLPPARADANQIEMALLNLSVNARDAMPEGGTLTISVAEDRVGSGHRSRLKAGHYVRLSVADTGIGMDAETARRAIEPFFSTKGVGKGTGLGLSMVHGLAAQLGGAMHIKSRPGRGTKVELWLPVADEAGTARESDAEAAELKETTGTVLLVDDEELVRASTADMLADLGYAVVEAASVEEALQRIADGLRPDLLVTDHLMPGASGTELAREVLARRLGARVLVVSGYAEVDGIASDLPRLSKPFRRSDLAAAIMQLETPPAGD